MSSISLPENNLPLSFDSLTEHMQIIRDECERLVKKQDLKNEAELDQKIGTLKVALLAFMDAYEDLPLRSLTGATGAELFADVFKDPSLSEELDLTDKLSLCKKIHNLFNLRNNFFDLFKKLPIEKKDKFESLIFFHQNMVSKLQNEYVRSGVEAEIAALPWIHRKVCEQLINAAMRTS